MQRSLVLIALLFVLNVGAVPGADRPHYSSAEVLDFTVAPNVNVVSQSTISELAAEISANLKRTDLFREVNVGNDADFKPPKEPYLKVMGEFTEFKPGSKTRRYLSTGLAGHTNVGVHVAFVDSASGKTILESNLRGTVRIGSSNHAASVEIAREIARLAENHLQ